MSISKREEIRSARLKKKRQQRMATLLGVGGFILLVVALIGLPSVIDKYRPAGEFNAATPVERPLANGLAMGDPNAPVVIEVFEDFQCSACKVYSESIETMIVASGYIENGYVYYIFRQYPFLDDSATIKQSDATANASMCANEQGSFWEYHDLLFANQGGENAGGFTDRLLIAFADSIGLDVDQFTECYEQNAYQALIQADIDLGIAYKISGTPSVLVNGELLTPGMVPTYEEIMAAVDAALASSTE